MVYVYWLREFSYHLHLDFCFVDAQVYTQVSVNISYIVFISICMIESVKTRGTTAFRKETQWLRNVGQLC